MVAVFVTFQYGSEFSEAAVRNIAEGARGKFEGMPGLRSKVFTLRPEKKQAVNVYVWETEAAARAFFTDQLLERVTGLYGVRPTVEFGPVAALVENRPA
jgi:heme-degrading monooxygenase HmoA